MDPAQIVLKTKQLQVVKTQKMDAVPMEKPLEIKMDQIVKMNL